MERVNGITIEIGVDAVAIVFMLGWIGYLLARIVKRLDEKD